MMRQPLALAVVATAATAFAADVVTLTDARIDTAMAKADVKSKKVFEAANPDGDGTLDIAEFSAALVAQAK